MDPLTTAAIMAGIGVLKNELIERPKEERALWLASQTQRYSPWTKMDPNSMMAMVPRYDPLSSALQGAIQGYAFGEELRSKKFEEEAGKSKFGVDKKLPVIRPKTYGNSAWDYLSEK